MAHRTSTPALHVAISCWNRPKNARSWGTKRSFILFNLLVTLRDQIVLPRLVVPSGRWPTHGALIHNKKSFYLDTPSREVEAIRPPRAGHRELHRRDAAPDIPLLEDSAGIDPRQIISYP